MHFGYGFNHPLMNFIKNLMISIVFEIDMHKICVYINNFTMKKRVNSGVVFWVVDGCRIFKSRPFKVGLVKRKLIRRAQKNDPRRQEGGLNNQVQIEESQKNDVTSSVNFFSEQYEENMPQGQHGFQRMNSLSSINEPHFEPAEQVPFCIYQKALWECEISKKNVSIFEQRFEPFCLDDRGLED